tara:strand:- start:470 stop:2293 length:1824 start_codon:yes stop_codon:yes gene_type:complete
MISQTEENVIGAYELVEISYKILADNLESEMQNAFVPFLAAYKNVNGKVKDINLSKLKAKLGDDFDLYIIDKEGVIIHTTFEKDQDLDFSKIAPDFNKKLQAIRIKGGYQGDRIASTIKTGEVRKFGYWGTSDKEYILEIGIASSKFDTALKKIDLSRITKNFEDFNPDLKSATVFKGDGKIFNNPDFKASKEQVTNVKNVFTSGNRLDISDSSKSQRIIYIKADIDDEDSASHGDRVIELVFDTGRINKKLNEIAINQALITIIFVFVGGVISLLISKRLANPISDLTNAVGSVARGNLEEKIPQSSNTMELKLLASGLTSMVKNIKEKIFEIEKINSSFERFVPKEFLHLLEKKQITDIEVGDSASLKMSVLFSDMRDFTSISEKMTPDENFTFLNNYLDALAPAIKDNNGFIDKYVGDAVMALFTNNGDDPVKAAIAMNLRLNELNHRSKNNKNEKVRMGVGIHCGNLILGTIGQEERMETTVISDTVNASARLETLNKIYGTKILISSQLKSNLSDELMTYTRLIDNTQVKGKTDFVEVYEVFAADDENLQKLKIETKPDFEKAVSLFLDGDLKKSTLIFKDLYKNVKEDSVLRYWIEKLQKA